MEAKLQEKQLKEKEEGDRQRRIAAKLKEKVGVVQGTTQSNMKKTQNHFSTNSDNLN